MTQRNEVYLISGMLAVYYPEIDTAYWVSNKSRLMFIERATPLILSENYPLVGTNLKFKN